jgi:CBS domain-containing protein
MKTVKQLLEQKGRALITIEVGASVLQALQTMAEHDVGALPVLDGGKLVGILSERDYARKVVLHGKSSVEVPVSAIMTARVTSVSLQQSVEDCMTLMSNGHFRHLPVLEHGQLIGMLSIGDLVKEVISGQAEVIGQLEKYIHT